WNTLVGGANTVKLIFVDKDSGYVIGQYGGLLKTINGGASLSTIISGINNVLIKGATLSNNSIYAVGQSGTVLRHVLGCTGPPQLTAAITGVNNTCVFNTDTFTLPLITGATYQWEDLYGAQVLQINPYQVTVHWLMPGTFYVKANLSNACGTSETVNLKVTVHALPAVPLITQSGNTLICNYANGVQWYLNGTLMPGETNDSLQATQNGTYSVSYTDSLTCGSSSGAFSFSFTGMKTNGTASGISIFPNPTSGSLSVTANSMIQRISICDLSGRRIQDQFVSPGIKSVELNPELAAGTYFIIVETAETTEALRLIKTAD
ncbi:MAG: T9SS type A sorting domain-containing protein, partial [Bacteroidia bacterium]